MGRASVHSTLEAILGVGVRVISMPALELRSLGSRRGEVSRLRIQFGDGKAGIRSSSGNPRACAVTFNRERPEPGTF